jgi:hypothetical protein
MPTSRGRKKRAKGQKSTPHNPQSALSRSQHWTRLQKLWAIGLATLGLAASIAAFWPRVSIDVQQPVDELDPWSSPVGVTNGFPALENVNLALGLCNLRLTEKLTLRGSNFNCNIGTGVFLESPAMRHHRLSIDDKWEVFFSDFIPIDWRSGGSFSGGDVTFKLTFTPWPLSIFYGGAMVSKEFRWIATKTGDKWRWIPKPIDKSYAPPRPNFADRFKVRK